MSKFDAGDTFPALQGFSVDHGMVSLPKDIPEGNWGIVLAYRAHW